jgi:hypothetical protein
MKTVLFAFVSLLLSFNGCKKTDESKVPDCLSSRISTFAGYACDSGATVKSYTFQNHTVYAFDPGNCGADMTTEVVDHSCKTLGNLGGIMGNTRINGEDFSNAVFIEQVWSN